MQKSNLRRALRSLYDAREAVKRFRIAGNIDARSLIWSLADDIEKELDKAEATICAQLLRIHEKESLPE